MNLFLVIVKEWSLLGYPAIVSTVILPWIDIHVDTVGSFADDNGKGVILTAFKSELFLEVIVLAINVHGDEITLGNSLGTTSAV